MKFRVTTSYTGYRVYEVEADSEASAMKNYFNGTEVHFEDDDEWAVEAEEM